jgi:hypothetical protein
VISSPRASSTRKSPEGIQRATRLKELGLFQLEWCEQTSSRTASQTDDSSQNRGRHMLEFSPQVEMKKIAGLAEEFSKNILDDEPFFVSDEATILDVSAAEPEELITRISNYYGKTISMADLQQPLWKLIRQLNEGHSTGRLR